MLATPLDEWEQWAVIHAGELLPDGRPRFRTVLMLVARQNGKTFLLRILRLYWLFVEQWPVIVATSTNRKYAKKEWDKVCNLALGNELLRPLLAPRPIVKVTGSEALVTAGGCEDQFVATNRNAGRSLSIDRLVLDEVREHRSWEAWEAATGAMSARPFGQIWCITNQGDDQGVVLDSLWTSARDFIETGEGDDRLGLFEWSAPDGCDVTDLHALAQANPNLGRRINADDLRGSAVRAAQKGGDEEAAFRTNYLCQRVRSLNVAIDPTSWKESFVDGNLSELRSRVAVCLDISPDRQHATLVGAAKMADDRVRVGLLGAWTDTQQLRRDLPGLLARIRPQKLGWIPNGPAAALAADLRDRKDVRGWPPAGVAVEEITGEVSAICMGLADFVKAGQVVHANDPLLNAHIGGAEKLITGDTWRFQRKGEGHCDAAYAVAGAVHLARTMPPPVGKPRIITAS